MGPGAADIAEVVSEVRERSARAARAAAAGTRAGALPPLRQHLGLHHERVQADEPIWCWCSTISTGRTSPRCCCSSSWRASSGDARMLVLGTYRDVELGAPAPARADARGAGPQPVSPTACCCGASHEEDVARFIELSVRARLTPATARGSRLPRDRGQSLLRPRGREPAGVRRAARESRATVESWSVEIPQGVRQVIGRRLSTLSPECNALLTTAAVMGREFDFAVLAQVAELVRGRKCSSSSSRRKTRGSWRRWPMTDRALSLLPRSHPRDTLRRAADHETSSTCTAALRRLIEERNAESTGALPFRARLSLLRSGHRRRCREGNRLCRAGGRTRD